MQNREAERILRERVDGGGRLVAVQRADWRTVKLLRERCHTLGVPTLLLPAAGAG